MEKVQKYVTFFGDRLINREVPLNLIPFIREEDLFLLSNVGLPNSNEFSFDFLNEIVFLDNNIKIGTRCDLIIYYDIDNFNIFSIYEGERKFYASSLIDFLAVIYEYENIYLDIGNNLLGEFYKNKKAYRTRFLEKLLAINADFQTVEEYIGWHIGCTLEELE